MKARYLLLSILFLNVVFISCKKDSKVNVETVSIITETITPESVTVAFACDYKYISVLDEVRVYLSENEDMSASTNYPMQVDGYKFTGNIEGLLANSTYFYYYEYYNGFNRSVSEVKYFNTVAKLPQVVTAEVSAIDVHSAMCGGEVVSDGGSSITARGVCWRMDSIPTIEDNHTLDGTGMGDFVSSMSELSAFTTYYVRAYAVNAVGIAYGETKSFATVSQGALPGLFSVSDSKWVYFSQGNLQYQASTNTWRFATNQYDMVGCGTHTDFDNDLPGNVSGSDNEDISPTYSGWIDLFGWGTSGYHNPSDSYNVNYLPWSTSGELVESDYNYYGYGPSTNMPSPDLTGSSAEYDWGVHNAISNGGNATQQWRTLTVDEWDYLRYTRPDAEQKWGEATVNGVTGLIFLPDTWTLPSGCSFTAGCEVSFVTNIYTASQWQQMEQAGALFLPAAGERIGTDVIWIGRNGSYWSSSFGNGNGSSSCNLNFNSDDAFPACVISYYGRSVRLVRDY